MSWKPEDGKIVTYHKCPVCNARYTSLNEAVRCRNQHLIKTEKWFILPDGSGMRTPDNWGQEMIKNRIKRFCKMGW